MEKIGVDCRRRTIRTVRNMRRRTRHLAIDKVENTLTKKIWLHLHSPIEIVGGRKLQWDHLMSVGQHNNRRSCCPHDVKRDDINMGEGTMVLLCRLGLLLVGEGTSGSSFWMAGRLGCTAGLVGGEGSSSIWVHLGEGERRSAAGGRGRKEFWR
jgi:hypothetical protein